MYEFDFGDTRRGLSTLYDRPWSVRVNVDPGVVGMARRFMARVLGMGISVVYGAEDHIRIRVRARRGRTQHPRIEGVEDLALALFSFACNGESATKALMAIAKRMWDCRRGWGSTILVQIQAPQTMNELGWEMYYDVADVDPTRTQRIAIEVPVRRSTRCFLR